MVILPTGGSARSQQKKRLVNGKKRCWPSPDTVAAQAVKVGAIAIPTQLPPLHENRADRGACKYQRKRTEQYGCGSAVKF